MGLTKQDKQDLRAIKKTAKAIIGSGSDPDQHRKDKIVRLADDILERDEDEEPAPVPGYDELRRVRMDFLRNRHPQWDRGYYGAATSFAGLTPHERAFYLQQAKDRGHSHFAFDLVGGGSGNPYVRPNIPAFNLNDKPTVVAVLIQQINSYGLTAMPILFEQRMVKDWNLDRLTDFAAKHAQVWGTLNVCVWATFEQEESVKLNGTKEGMRGDYWLAELGRRVRGLFVGRPVACHFATEIDWYSDKHGKGDSFDVVLYQFPAFPPTGVVAHIDKHIYGDELPRYIDSSVAHRRDWDRTLERGNAEAPNVVYVPAEYCQVEDGKRGYPSWSDADVWEIGDMLAGMSNGMRGNGP